MNENIEFREIIKSDNKSISKIIKSVLTELNANKKGTAFYDKETDAMYEAYQTEKSVYYIALINNEIVGGCGIHQLKGAENTICELQKMYILSEARGLKIGETLLKKCLVFATKYFEKCYLETFPQMKSAINLYKKNDFKLITKSLGNTSHTACNVWFLKNLKINNKVTVKELKTTLKIKLEGLYPQTEIDSFYAILTEFYFNLKRVDIILNPDLLVDKTKFENAIIDLINQKPIQYIIEETEFFGLPFLVDKNVLIPRPETEELVQKILNDYKLNSKKITLLDIGTGSGCIAISLAKNLKNAKISALDISEKALQIAKKNAVNNKVTIDFILNDILNLKFNSKILEENSKFDVIVSNPPYVRDLEKQEIAKNVLDNEPHLALFVKDDNPLLFYDKIADFALKHLKKNGKLYFEINQYLGDETVALLIKKGFKNIILQKDMYGNNRMIFCEI